MREMKDVWKEMVRGGEEDEGRPLARGGGKASVKGPAARGATYQTNPDEHADAIFDTGFALRELGPKAVRAWLSFQGLSLCFQLLLWNEVSAHLWEFEEVVTRECAPERRQHGVCTGPLWNLTSWQDVVLTTGPAGGTFQFDFSTTSRPPTFLLTVDPVSWARAGDAEPAPAALAEQAADLKDARWSIEVSRKSPPQVGQVLHRFQAGSEAFTFEDLSSEAQTELGAAGRVTWHASLASRGVAGRRVRYAVYVEDANVARLEEARRSPQCAFGRAWKAFNEQHQGHSHRMLSWCKFLLGVFLVAGVAVVGAVNEELKKGSMGYKFHLLVIAKFILQDVPQQVCIVLYLLGWYEAAGLRCQLCLFHPRHCSAEQAFHLANLLAVICTLLSSVANQLLIRPIFKREYSEEDLCELYSMRVGGTCLAILPFTTGVLVASRSVLPLSGLMHVVFLLPCGIGWLTLSAIVCVPIFVCCEDL